MNISILILIIITPISKIDIHWLIYYPTGYYSLGAKGLQLNINIQTQLYNQGDQYHILRA